MSISVSGSSNFISNDEILQWMETKTDGIYGRMRDAMDTSNSRAEAEDALNKIKAKLVDAEATGKDAALLRQDLKDAIHEYATEYPDVAKTLQPILDELDKRANENLEAAQRRSTPTNAAWATNRTTSNAPSAPAPAHILAAPLRPDPVKLKKEDSDAWSAAISTQVDAFSKQDQLGLINIQELNAQINQAKQTASAMMDSADKSANTIVSHIG